MDASAGPYIEFENVCKAFGKKVVLDDVSFNVMPGETLAILGRSGVGKSVTLRLLMGFLKPDSGRIRVAFEEINGYSEAECEALRRKVTMVFQNGALFDSLSIEENIAFPLRERGKMSEEELLGTARHLMELLGIEEYKDQLPSDLSTGMRRSVAIARALAANPEAILYDEPTTMVDPLMAHQLANLIRTLKTKLHLTSIVVTHDMALANKIADRVVFLHEGHVAFFGTPAEMERCDEPIVREFQELDRLDLSVWRG
jgi:phospholipid/cholesterol/gamma-HCH transport system ATP-binding protein